MSVCSKTVAYTKTRWTNEQTFHRKYFVGSPVMLAKDLFYQNIRPYISEPTFLDKEAKVESWPRALRRDNDQSIMNSKQQVTVITRSSSTVNSSIPFSFLTVFRFLSSKTVAWPLQVTERRFPPTVGWMGRRLAVVERWSILVSAAPSFLNTKNHT